MADFKECGAHVAMYLRKSRAEEGENTAEVLSRHRSILTAFAAAHSFPVEKIYEEVASGDSLFARPRMMELLKDIEDRRYTGLLCVDIDRLGRGNMQEQGLILNTLKDAGTVIITPEKIYDLNNELDETQTEFKTFFARQELKMIKKRLSRGIQMTIRKGGYIANAPYGYVKALKGKLPTLKIDPEEAETVRDIFQLYISGNGCQTIAEILNESGSVPHRAKRWCRNSVREIIKNPVYIGKIVWNRKKCLRPKKIGDKHQTLYQKREDWTIYNGLHPPIVDEAAFHRANQILESRYHPPYRKPNQIKNPLAGLIYCRRCGRALVRMASKGAKYQRPMLICPTKGCTKAARLDYVESELVSKIEREFPVLTDEKKTGKKNDQTDLTLKLRAEKAAMKRLTSQREKIYEFLEQGIYSREIFKEREKKLARQIREADAECQEIENQIEAESTCGKTPVPQIRGTVQEYWDGTPSERNEILKAVVNRVYYYKEKSAKPKGFTLDISLKRY